MTRWPGTERELVQEQLALADAQPEPWLPGAVETVPAFTGRRRTPEPLRRARTAARRPRGLH